MTDAIVDPVRLARAALLEVRRLEDGGYLVTGGSSPHAVTEAGCDCQDFSVRGGPCKHMLAVRLAGLDLDLQEAVRVLAEELICVRPGRHGQSRGSVPRSV